MAPIAQQPRPYDAFMASCERSPEAIALEIAPHRWTYAQMAQEVGKVAQLLVELEPNTHERVGVLATRSLTAYAGCMAVLGTGHTLVALNPNYPPERNAAIIQRSGLRTLVVGPEGLSLVNELARLSGTALRVVAPHTPSSLALPNPTDEVVGFWGAEQVQALAPLTQAREVPGDALVYLVFTSGSTGQPKGVAIGQDNLAAYMRNFRHLSAPLDQDRVATTFELTFDVALHDLINAWWSGSTLVVMPEKAMMAPARFILSERITVWSSVASFAMTLQSQGLLRPDLFPLLRVSMLCGEALPQATAAAWAAAAPNSVVFNVYGPTETTMEMAFYRWLRGVSDGLCLRGVTPIGVPFADHQHILLDEQGQEVVGAGIGELYISGPQVGPGYWQDPERTAAAFVQLPGRPGRWYKTNDRIERDANGLYHFICRVDFMVKVRGQRVELGEVEHALREVSGCDMVAVLPLPLVNGTCQGLVGFVEAADDAQALHWREQMTQRLPKAMWPQEVRVLSELPLNANRKVDRNVLGAMLQDAQPA